MKIISRNGATILIDEKDKDLVMKGGEWGAYDFNNGCKYAQRNGVYMHRLILGADKGQYVDHINRDGLDNRRCNLRIVTQSQNLANAKMFKHNSTGYRGVTPYRLGFQSQVKYKQRNIKSIEMEDPKICALLRDEIVRQIYGEHVYLNFPDERPDDWMVKEAARLIAMHGTHFR